MRAARRSTRFPAWATRVKAFPSESEAVVVRVVGEQFAWNIHYPGPDGKFGRTDIKLVTADNPLGLDRTDPDAKDDITTINQLNLPVDRPVLVHLSSKDVIHSFGLYRDAREAGRDSRHDDSGLVHPEPHRRVRDHLLAALRPRPLPDARLRHHPEPTADYQKWFDDQEKELQPAAATAGRSVSSSLQASSSLGPDSALDGAPIARGRPAVTSSTASPRRLDDRHVVDPSAADRPALAIAISAPLAAAPPTSSPISATM